MNLLFKIFTPIICIIFLFSCKKKDINNPDYWDLPPNRFFFQILKDGAQLDDSTLSVLKMYYIDKNGYKVYRNKSETMDFPEHIYLPSRYGDHHLDSLGIRVNYFLPGMATFNNVNEWYFEYGNGDIDTLYVEGKEISNQEGRNNDCYCTTPITVVRFNGRNAYKHPTLTADGGKPIYVLEK